MTDATQASCELPRYKCHKTVHALKIKRIDTTPDSGGLLVFFPDDGISPIQVFSEYMQKHQPKPGGYYIVYEDGYKSFSPADAFERGYSPVHWPNSATVAPKSFADHCAEEGIQDSEAEAIARKFYEIGLARGEG